MIRRRRPLSVEEEHLQALEIGSRVTRWYRKEWEPNVLEVTPENVIAALHEAGIDFVLMGVHGINGYRDEARATQDVDVLVPKKNVGRAIRVLDEAFPYLEIHENSVVARFVNPVTQKVVIDVMKPSSEAMRAVFRNTVRIGRTHRIPDLEMALVLKFLAFRGPNRKLPKKYMDAGDFTNMVQHNRRRIDMAKLLRLAGRFYPRGAAVMQGIIDDIDNDRPIQLD